jgi:hypothetical protein
VNFCPETKWFVHSETYECVKFRSESEVYVRLHFVTRTYMKIHSETEKVLL